MSDAIRVVSLFCGIGGADLGLYRAADALGIEVEVVDAIDHWEPAARVYNANLPHPVARVADVKKLTRKDLPEHDLVIGGPPCQPFTPAGRRNGHDDPRNCIPDFLRLADGSPWVMENVRHLLIQAPWSEQINAFECGDATERKRWIYSSHLLHVWRSDKRRTIGDIREAHLPGPIVVHRPRKDGKEAERRGDDLPMPSMLGNAWHMVSQRQAGGIGRNPTLLEMQRAHSLPDTFDWTRIVTKAQRGQMIANSWPVEMATAIGKAILTALSAEREMAA